jgi:HD-GYP domain-containing protein (c-di-GMP phosphodiesterase class II)
VSTHVKLVPFSSQYIRRDKPLPFGLRDVTGRLLLAAGERIDTDQQMNLLAAQNVFVDEYESAEWTRRLQAAMDLKIRQGATLSQVAAVSVDEEAHSARPQRPLSLPEQWEELISQLDTILRDVRADTDWLPRLHVLMGRAQTLLQRRPDAALYLGVYEAAHSSEKYSSHHAMLVMQICELTGPILGWPKDWTQALSLAALSMNVGMHRLQDQLALTTLPLTPQTKDEIGRHAEVGAALLREAGVADALWLETVRLHHDASGAELPLASLPPPRQLARLLRRVDIFTATLSRRATRSPMSPVQAAREACLGAGGVPDEIGSALLKAVGLYPPGSFVELASGEIGIVIARGRRANLPLVASLIGASGNIMMEPALRDTIERRHAVKGAMPSGSVKVRPPHDRLLALR